MSAGSAAADEVLLVEFQERETGDSFKVSNIAPCDAIRVKEISLDLATARSGLIFDTQPGGPGYDDEPTGGITVLAGDEFVKGTLRMEDGTKVVTLQLNEFRPGDSFRFALDVDDTETGPVPGPDDDASARDMEGATFAAIMFNDNDFRRAEITAFNETGNARLEWPRACVDDEAEEPS
jgi:hypothetical protein